MSSEITKCCPFCGTPAKCEDGEHEANMKLEYYMGSKERPHYVQCIMCNATGPLSATVEEAIYEWNNAKWVQWLDRETEPSDIKGDAP
jgi:hypothetical protein